MLSKTHFTYTVETRNKRGAWRKVYRGVSWVTALDAYLYRDNQSGIGPTRIVAETGPYAGQVVYG